MINSLIITENKNILFSLIYSVISMSPMQMRLHLS